VLERRAAALGITRKPAGSRVSAKIDSEKLLRYK
jgi:hypothetical protein